MTVKPPDHLDTEATPPDVAPEQQAAFFARLDAQLDDEGHQPEPTWKARTLGHFALNPQAYRLAMTACITTVVVAGGWVSYMVHLSNQPPEPLRLPQGYLLISTPDGQVIAVRDEQKVTPEEVELRTAALRELQHLLSEPAKDYPADGIAVSSSSSP